MKRRIIAATAALGIALVALPQSAHADDDFRSIIREEIKAYMDAQKAKDKEKKEAEKAKKEEEKKEKDKKDASTFKVYWKNGLRLDTKDKSVKLKIGGRIMFDAWVHSDNDYEDVTGIELEDGVEFRRLRLYNSGQIGKHVKYKAQIDFAADPGDEFSIKDAYIDLVNLKDCLGCGFPNIRFGHFKAPFSLEELTSSKYITFMERSLPNVFAPGRLSGVMLHESWLGDHLNVGVGAFAENTSDGEDGIFEADGWGLAARATYAIWWDCDCKCNRWQIGASAWSRQDIDELRFRQRPESHVTGYRPADTRDNPFDDIPVDSALHWGLETVFTYGPWSVQAEYITANLDSAAANDPSFTGWYAYVSYWLTGECRPLKKGTMGRVSPCCDFLDEDCCCKGGWELAARVSALDLTDGNVDGGEFMNFTFGVNWHLNPNTRIMWNAVLTDVDRGRDANGDTILVNESFLAFGMRVQVDW